VKSPPVMREALGERIDLETRLDPKTLEVKNVLILHGTQSTAEVRQMIDKARELLRNRPEPVDTVELALDKAAAEQVMRARARRVARSG